MIWLITPEGQNYVAPPEFFIGSLPAMLSETDPRPAREQLNERYPFGGWMPIRGLTMNSPGVLSYPNDPDMRPLAIGQFRDETIFVYESSVIAIVQQDGSFEAARMD